MGIRVRDSYSQLLNCLLCAQTLCADLYIDIVVNPYRWYSLFSPSENVWFKNGVMYHNENDELYVKE